MRKRSVGSVILLAGALLAVISGVAGAREPGEVQRQILELEGERRAQGEALAREMQRVVFLGEELREAQARLEAAQSRAGELESEARELRRLVRERESAVAERRSEYEESVRAAYRGEGVGELVGILESLAGGESFLSGVRAVRVLGHRQSSMERYRESRVRLENTARQLEQKGEAYERAAGEERRQQRELLQKKRRLERAISRLGGDVARIDAELARLRDEHRELLSRPGVSMGSSGGLAYELSVADKIVAEPVEELELIEYQRLYREAAEEYGFGEDWYILAAVGKVESNHGQNMGPSSAGALGPMQFLPSTWEAHGVDGNGDGRANIMDPEDAIPAAAAYLVLNGAPGDWYRALFAYNHADWYVMQVLAVAEAYRQRAGDEDVGPYT